jgi:hypothetical protein
MHSAHTIPCNPAPTLPHPQCCKLAAQGFAQAWTGPHTYNPCLVQEGAKGQSHSAVDVEGACGIMDEP